MKSAINYSSGSIYSNWPDPNVGLFYELCSTSSVQRFRPTWRDGEMDCSEFDGVPRCSVLYTKPTRTVNIRFAPLRCTIRGLIAVTWRDVGWSGVGRSGAEDDVVCSPLVLRGFIPDIDVIHGSVSRSVAVSSMCNIQLNAIHLAASCANTYALFHISSTVL